MAPRAVVALGAGAVAVLGASPAGDQPVPEVVAVGASVWWADPGRRGPDEAVVVAATLRHRSERPAGDERLLRAELRALSGQGPHLPDPDWEEVAATAMRLRSHGWNRTDAHHVAWLAAPPLTAARRFAGRVTVVHGSADPLVPVEHGRALAAAVDAPFVEVPGAGHHPERPLLEAIAAVLGSQVVGAEPSDRPARR